MFEPVLFNNASRLLRRLAPGTVHHLREEYNYLEDGLSGKTELGGGGYVEAERPAALHGLKGEVEIMLLALKTAIDQSTPVRERLKERLKRTKNIRLLAGVVAAIISSGLFGILLGGAEEKQLLAGIGACLNLGAAIALLYANHLETPDYGGAKNVAELFDNISSLFARAQQAMQTLKLRTESNKATEAELRALIDQGEKICYDMNELLTKI